ncbi:MAG: hypothetical protein JW737_03370 [Acidobacteria bacterium]|nr:hypothetical protein [Acidobacteriota bacterium]
MAEDKKIKPADEGMESDKQGGIKRSDIYALIAGILFSALPFFFTGDYIFFRFLFFSFVGFQFGSRVGLIFTLPTAIAMFFAQPELSGLEMDSPGLYKAMLFAAPVLGYISGRIKEFKSNLDKANIIVFIFCLALAGQLYLWMIDKPDIIVKIFIFLMLICAFFLWKYRTHMKNIKLFFWLLMAYYFTAFILFFPITRFTGDIKSFYNSLVYLLPGDILALFLAAVVSTQMDVILDSFKKARISDDR